VYSLGTIAARKDQAVSTSDASKAEPKGDSPEPEREYSIYADLDDWPYIPQYLQESLDHELINHHGEAILRRGLNSGRVVCFVGSGISMAYGRIGWGDLVKRLTQSALDDTSGVSSPRIARLRSTLEALRVDDDATGGGLQSSRFPAVFQFGELLERARVQPGDSALDESAFRNRVMQLLYDDRGHAHLLFRDLVKDLEVMAGHAKVSGRILDEVAQELISLVDPRELTRKAVHSMDDSDPGILQSHWMSYFQLCPGVLHRWAQLTDQRFAEATPEEGARPLFHAKRLLQAISVPPGVTAREPNSPRSLLPLHRFVVPAVMRLLPVRAVNLPDALSAANGPTATLYSIAISKLSARDCKIAPQSTRADTIPAQRDPLLLLASGLGIGRFITTNYDLDIERLLRDKGFTLSLRSTRGLGNFPKPNGTASTQINDALGAEARDSVFRAETALDLVDFSVQNQDHAFNVVHLHGRATLGDDMVVTERDYLDRYLRKGDEADMVNIAISLAFAANPVLFVGSGMNEDDILRPLRQFVAERRNRSDRKAVVLLPAGASRAKQIEEAVLHYSRFGVFTVHFGFAEFDEVNGSPGAEEQKPNQLARQTRWLALLQGMCRDLDRWHDLFLKSLEPGQTAISNLMELTRLTRANWFEVSGGKGSEIKRSEAWQTLVLDPQAEKPLTLRKPCKIDGAFVLGASELNPSAELALLEWVLNVTVDLAAQCFEGGLLPADKLPKTGKAQRNLGGGFDTRFRAWQPIALTARALLRDLPSALTGLCMCAKLSSIREQWLSWRLASEQLPVPRRNGGPRWLIPANLHTLPREERYVRVLARHPIALRTLVGTATTGAPHALGGDRFLENSPSRTFDTFCRTLAAYAGSGSSSRLSQSPMKAGRRVFVLLASRGVGKGHFFETLRMPQHIKDFRESSWPKGQAPRYDALAHFNLSFCHEVMSVFDRLTNMLVERAPSIFGKTDKAKPDAADEIFDASARLKKHRVGRLKKVLALYAEHAKKAKDDTARIVVAFNGFNFLFDERGFAKNAQLYRLVMSMLGPEASAAPIDFILVCSESSFPRLFREFEKTPELNCKSIHDGWSEDLPVAMEHLIHPDSGEKGEREVKLIAQRLRVCLADGIGAPKNLRGRDSPPGSQSYAFFHVLRGARASSTITKYFPEVAMAMAARPRALQDVSAIGSWGAPIHIPAPAHMESLRRAIFETSRDTVAGVGASSKDPLPAILSYLVEYGTNRPTKDSSIEKSSWGLLALKKLLSRPSDVVSESNPFKTKEIGEDFKYLFRELGRNRFLLTIVCAAAAELGCADAPHPNSEWRVLQPDQVTNWLRNLLAAHLSSGQTQRADAVIGAVFGFYQSQHDAHKPLPEVCRIRPNLEEGLNSLKEKPGFPPEFSAEEDGRFWSKVVEAARIELAGPAGWVLQQHLLWHLAVAGHPVEADVLAEAPKIRRAGLQIIIRAACAAKGWGRKQLQAANFSTPLKRGLTRLVVALCLDLLVHRCLVFRLGSVHLDGREAEIRDVEAIGQMPNAEQLATALSERRASWITSESKENAAFGGSETLDPLSRFALHRFVQRAIFQRLHSPYVEYPQVDQFSLSMWATQPDELPRPTPAAAREIAELMAQWTGFPHRVSVVDRDSVYHRALADAFGPASDPVAQDAAVELSRPARMLRAAFGVVRSVYSVGVVTRYHDQDSASPDAPVEGFVEQHRLQIRWMLRKAVELKSHVDSLKKTRAPEPVPGAGTAESPFFAEEIVWLYNECGLLCLIQGKLEAAAGLFRRALRAARQIEAQIERGALWSRVHLNLAMVDIERGRIRDAKAYLTLIRDTRDENPILRLLAQGFIGLTEHLAGDLDLAERIYKDVILDLERYGQSRSIAIFSRHLADLYRLQGKPKREAAHAAVDRAIARAAQGGHEDIRQLGRLSRVRLQIDERATDNTGGIQRELDSIERYGRQMGMPRILADVAHARALHLLDLGETHHASTLAATSLEIATANDLRLRQVTALSLLAKTCERRGLGESAASLTARAEQLAESCNFASARGNSSRRPTSRLP
jgi:tetratricopeptide (TPR) repeat protein